MAKGRRLPQEINAGSMADIAFLLLVFFLVTTTMDTDWGLQRLLPPPADPLDETVVDVRERNVFVVLANANDQLLVEGELLDISQLKDKAIEFILNPNNSEELPEKIKINAGEAKGRMAEMSAKGNGEGYAKWNKRYETAKEVGDYWESKQVISLQNDRGTTYDLYIQVQNELAAAYEDLRDNLSKEKFGVKYSELEGSQAKAVRNVYPQRISEAEPKNIGGE